ncbi:DUF262 domain-containing protein [Halomonas sp. HMF6819]|uniref:DUF262 domain-containing protein n=1 Tax=Halomonas sp. HMF6819 TaxID=3373085 RepID=UPI0037BC339D
MSLSQQIEDHSRNVQTQSYSMSVSEIVSMYKDGELELHPEFQRFFRWTREQKSRLIESLILGIPVPPVFVSERSDGKWDVIDGLQRLSTVLELMGELKDDQNQLINPLQLTRTHYLPDLEECVWNSENGESSLPDVAQIRLKRARLDVNIVRSTSDSEVKYEVFQRLNTGGATATGQEVRNCLLVMANIDYFHWVKALSEFERFRETLSLTDRAIDEAFDMELVSRYLIFTRKTFDDLHRIDELGSYLNHELVAQANDLTLPKENIESIFLRIFEFLSSTLGSNAFRRYDDRKEGYVGPMLVSLFEVVAVSLGVHLENGGNIPDAAAFREKHKHLWNELSANTFVGSGVRASTRIPETVRFGQEWIRR